MYKRPDGNISRPSKTILLVYAFFSLLALALFVPIFLFSEDSFTVPVNSSFAKSTDPPRKHSKFEPFIYTKPELDELDRQANNCGVAVITRTEDGERFIEELIAYYLVQGVEFIHLLDYSKTQNVKKELENYIDSQYLVHEVAKEPYDVHNESFALHGLVMQYVEKFKLDYERTGKIWWIVSVDDDDFIYPLGNVNPISRIAFPTRYKTSTKQTLKQYLCSGESLRYKTIQFRWREVGTNGILVQQPLSFRHDPNSSLDIELFTAMTWKLHREIGKSAFQVTHPQVSYSDWNYHGETVEGRFSTKRKNGIYFIHGNVDFELLNVQDEQVPVEKKFLGSYAVLQSGYSFHFSRSKEQLMSRINRWGDDKTRKFKLNKAITEKDSNDVIENILSRWAPRVRHIIQTLGSGKSKKIDYALLESIQLEDIKSPVFLTDFQNRDKKTFDKS